MPDFQLAVSQVAVIPHPSSQKASACSIASAINDPNGLRNILMIAAFQHAWKFGGLGTFEQTFLYHKFQTVRLVNSQLRPSDFVTVCADHIITLCFSEFTFGNFEVAETHLTGMMLYMEARDSKPQDQRHVVAHEFCDRYFILAYNMVQAIKSRLDDYLASPAGARYGSRSQLSPEERERLIPEMHSYEADGAAICFDPMSLLPSFFSSYASRKRLNPIDASGIVSSLREITCFFDMRKSPHLVNPVDKSPYKLWDQGGPSRLFNAVVNAHIDSSSSGPENRNGTRPDLQSSWIGTCVVVGMYLTSILGVWNQGQPEEDRLLHYILRTSHRDLARCFPQSISSSSKAQEFWFWKLFVTNCHLAHARMNRCSAWMGDLSFALTGLMRAWARMTRTRSWQDTRDKLAQIVWPANFDKEGLAESVWKTALGQ